MEDLEMGQWLGKAGNDFALGIFLDFGLFLGGNGN
jgi:hypothetical protein